MNLTQSLPPCKYLLKGDISGIQDFIFNVKSSGAAKSLKGRSFFIHALSLVGIAMVKQAFGEEQVIQFYNGGGNFYLFIRVGDKTLVPTLQKEIDGFCKHLNFHLTLSVIDVEGKEVEQNFGEFWTAINETSNADKLEKFSQTLSAFEQYPYTAASKDDWADFTKFLFQLEQAGKYGINKLDNSELTDNSQVTPFTVGARGANVLNYQFTQGQLALENIVLTLPRWNDFLIDEHRVLLEKERPEKDYAVFSKDPKEKYVLPRPDMIIDFSYLAHFAKERTGTGKIGILKMDVDHLGQIFNYLDYATAKEVSEALTRFFGVTINDLLQEEVQGFANKDSPILYKDNIYTIFSGGDDCFFVGAWDAILHWAQRIHQAFEQMAKTLTPLIKQCLKERIKEEEELEEMLEEVKPYIDPISVSAGLLILDPTYPVVRFADLAEAALSDAKLFTYQSTAKPKKNKISFMGEVLKWENFEDTLHVAALLVDLVLRHQEPRSTLEKIRHTVHTLRTDQKQALKGNFQRSNVSLLFYALRNSPNADRLSEKVIKPYAQQLISAFAKGEPMNPMKYPLAARIAEFSTRN